MPLLPYNTIAVRAERAYLTKETTFGTYVTPSNSSACRHVRMTLTPSIPLMNRRDKTGSLSVTAGIKGRIAGTFEIEMDLVGNGTAGNKPDCDLLIAAAMGQDGVTSPTVAITVAAYASSVLTLTVGTTAGMQSGQTWFITGITGTAFVAGNFAVTVIDATHFSIALAGGSGSYTVSSASATITGILYTVSDAGYSFDMWSFRNINGSTTTNLEQRVAGSCIITDLSISFGGDFATLTARGDCLCILDSVYFSSSSTAEKGGLGSFPTEPSAPITNGYPAPGFTGAITVDAQAVAEIKTGSVSIRTGRHLIRDSFGSYTATGIEATERLVTISLDMDDTDSAALANMKIKSKTKAPIAYSIQMGTVAGNIFTVSAANLILNPPAITEGQIRYRSSFSGGQSYASTYTSKDELALVAA